MTAPAEDPRGGEVSCSRGISDAEHWIDGYYSCPAAGRGDTDSGGEPTVRVRGEQVAVHLTGDGWFLVNDARWLAPTEVEDWEVPTSPAARPAGDRAQPTQEPSSNDVAVEDVRAIAVALGLGGHARPYSAHDVVHREILPALAALLDAQAAVSRVEAVIEIVATSERFGKPKVRGYQTPAMREVLAMLRRALDGA